jgi:hypothetical protein
MSSPSPSPRRCFAHGFSTDGIRLRRLGAWVGGGLLCAALPASAQYSLTVADEFSSYQPPSSQRAPGPASGSSNMRLGPTEWTFGAGLGMTWTSNARMTSTDTSSSFILTPTVSANMFFPITERTSLTLGLTMGYSFYLNGDDSDLDGFYLAPNTRLSYTMYIGDVQLSFYDGISASQFAYTDPTVGNDNADARSLSNTFGASASTRLYKTSLSGGFAQNNSWELGGDNGTGDTGSQNLWAQAGYQIFPELTAGVNGGLTWQHYGGNNQTAIDGGFQWNIGPYASWLVTERLSVDGSFGYTVYTQDYKFGLPATDSGSMYWQLGITHRPADFLSYSLSAGHTISPGYYEGPTDAYNVSLGLSWQLLRNVTITTPFSYYNGETISPYDNLLGRGRFQTYATGISFGYAFSQHLMSNLGYAYNYRMQEGPTGDYTVNSVTLSFSYRF